MKRDNDTTESTYNNILQIIATPIIFLIATAVIIYYIAYIYLDRTVFFNFQLNLSQVLGYLIVFYTFIAIIIFNKRIKIEVSRYFHEPLSPYPISIFRVIFFGFLIVIYSFQLQNAKIMLQASYEIYQLPFTDWYFPFLVFSYKFYKTIYFAGISVAIISLVGFKYRYIAWLNILFVFYLIGLPMFLGKLYYMQMWLWACCLMVFSPAADVLSIDALLNRNKSKIHPSYIYGIAIKWIWIFLGVIYFFSAFWKLKDTGLSWALGENMINQMQIEWLTNYYHIPKFRLDQYPIIAHTGGLFILCIEIMFIFLIFVRKTRWIALLGGISIHWGASYFLHISMLDLQIFYTSILLTLLFPTSQESKSQTKHLQNYIYKIPIMAIGLFIFCYNCLFGFYNISSWPFSAYPSHSTNVTSTFTRIEFELPELGLDRFGLDSIAKSNHFRKDNFYSLSDKAISSYNKKDTIEIKKALKTLWGNWQIKNPELASFNHPSVFIIETPIAPEKKEIIIQKVKLSF